MPPLAATSLFGYQRRAFPATAAETPSAGAGFSSSASTAAAFALSAAFFLRQSLIR